MEGQSETDVIMEQIFIDKYYKVQASFCSNIHKDHEKIIDEEYINNYNHCFKNFDHVFEHLHQRVKNYLKKAAKTR